MMRRAGARVARHVVGIIDGAHHVLLEARGNLIGGYHRADLVAPGPVHHWLGGGADRAANAGGGRAREHDAASEQRAAIDQSVAGDGWKRFKLLVLLGVAHAGSPWRPPGGKGILAP